MVSFFFLFGLVMIVYGQWIQHNDPALPRGDEVMAIGYYDESIYLLYVLSVSVHGRIEIVAECRLLSV